MRRRRYPAQACPVCNTSFNPKHTPATYCSRECAGKRHKIAQKETVIRVCEACRETFFLVPSVARMIAGRFCSPECWNKSRNMSREERIATLRDMILPNLHVGSMIPTTVKLAKKLNVTPPTVAVDVRHVLDEAGVRTKTVRVGVRMVVVSINEDTDA